MTSDKKVDIEHDDSYDGEYSAPVNWERNVNAKYVVFL
jgi:hypothetical protein